MTIGTLLRKLRDSKGLTVRSISEFIGVSHSTYLDWEHDKSSPSLKFYFSMANAFDLSPVELMSYLSEQNTSPLSEAEKQDISGLRKMVTHYQNYIELLIREKNQMEMELVRLQEQ